MISLLVDADDRQCDVLVINNGSCRVQKWSSLCCCAASYCKHNSDALTVLGIGEGTSQSLTHGPPLPFRGFKQRHFFRRGTTIALRIVQLPTALSTLPTDLSKVDRARDMLSRWPHANFQHDKRKLARAKPILHILMLHKPSIATTTRKTSASRDPCSERRQTDFCGPVELHTTVSRRPLGRIYTIDALL